MKKWVNYPEMLHYKYKESLISYRVIRDNINISID